MGVADWVSQTADPDIEDDLVYIRKFIANLEALPAPTPVTVPAEPWPRD